MVNILQASPAEMQSLRSLFGAREDALRTGIVLQNKRYEVSNSASTVNYCVAPFVLPMVSVLVTNAGTSPPSRRA